MCCFFGGWISSALAIIMEFLRWGGPTKGESLIFPMGFLCFPNTPNEAFNMRFHLPKTNTPSHLPGGRAPKGRPSLSASRLLHGHPLHISGTHTIPILQGILLNWSWGLGEIVWVAGRSHDYWGVTGISRRLPEVSFLAPSDISHCSTSRFQGHLTCCTWFREPTLKWGSRDQPDWSFGKMLKILKWHLSWTMMCP